MKKSLASPDVNFFRLTENVFVKLFSKLKEKDEVRRKKKITKTRTQKRKILYGRLSPHISWGSRSFLTNFSNESYPTFEGWFYIWFSLLLREPRPRVFLHLNPRHSSISLFTKNPTRATRYLRLQSRVQSKKIGSLSNAAECFSYKLMYSRKRTRGNGGWLVAFEIVLQAKLRNEFRTRALEFLPRRAIH